jgi:hypothetical protein
LRWQNPSFSILGQKITQNSHHKAFRILFRHRLKIV